MDVVKVTTQAELDAALAAPRAQEIWICGTGRFVVQNSAKHWVRATESSHVVAWGSSHVVARESSHVEARESSHVVAWESSHVVARESSHVVAWESSHVVAWGSSHVVAWESSHVVAWGAAFVRAFQTANVAAKQGSSVVIMRHATTTQVDGATIIDVPPVTTAEAWCDYHGVEVKDGIALLAKAVRDDYRSSHGLLYTPGSIPVAPDWDGGRNECGGGLHFSPTPAGAKGFDDQATKFLLCPVLLSEMRAPRDGDTYPSKIKASGCCGPVTEVTLWREPVTPVVQPSV